MTENEIQQETPPPPPLPDMGAMMQQQQQIGQNVVTLEQAKMLQKQAKEQFKTPKKNARPTTQWLRPAHTRANCQFCPVGVEKPLQIDPTSGVYYEACDTCQYLLDALHVARANVRKYDTMVKRIQNGEIVSAIELTYNYENTLTQEERAHLREIGYYHKSEFVAALKRLIKDLQLEEL